MFTKNISHIDVKNCFYQKDASNALCVKFLIRTVFDSF